MVPNKMEKFVQSLFHTVPPFLDANHNMAKVWRMLPEHFHRLGLPIFVINCLAGKAHAKHHHFVFKSTISEMMTHAYKAFMVEVALYKIIYLLDFNCYGHLTNATDTTWFKSPWEYTNHI